MNLQEIINLRMAGFISRAAAYLMSKLGTLNPNTASKLASGSLEVTDAEIIHTFGVATGGSGGTYTIHRVSEPPECSHTGHKLSN
jgi:hypothetical protein